MFLGNFGNYCCHDWDKHASSQHSLQRRSRSQASSMGSAFCSGRSCHCSSLFLGRPAPDESCIVSILISSFISFKCNIIFIIRYTTGIVGGLSTIAVCAPSEKFLTMGGPLAIGLGAVFAASLGSMFLPPTTALGAGLYSISLYGGLVLFSGFLLYNTQRIVYKAERHPMYGAVPYDPVNA